MLRYAMAVPGMAVLLGATALPTQAATAFGTGAADAFLSVTLPEGTGLTPIYQTETLTAFEEQQGSGSASVLEEREADDAVALFSTDSAEAGPGLGSAAALTVLSGTIDVINDSPDAQSFGFALDWSLLAEAEADGPAALATGFASVSLLGPTGEVLFGEGLAFGDPGAYGTDEISGLFEGDLSVEAGQTATLEVVTEAGATASVIPVPAALPLMLTAFGGLWALRRHQRRT